MNAEIFSWSTFLNDYGRKFTNAFHIIAYLKSYPEILEKIRLHDLIEINQIESRQKDWLRLCSQFHHQLEKEFFKQYWIPLNSDGYDYFMDISDEKFPIFDVNYFFFEPYRWYKKFIVEEIADLLLAHDTGLDLAKVLYENDKKRWKLVDELFADRRKLGFDKKP